MKKNLIGSESGGTCLPIGVLLFSDNMLLERLTAYYLHFRTCLLVASIL